jgi:TRAP-type mannitol/chloroaromatic compound transport system substrate-binding protein
MEKHKIEVHDTPEEFYGEYLRACNKVLDKNSARDPFFKKVLESQQQFATLVAPYWTKSLQLYRVLGNAGLGHQDKR